MLKNAELHTAGSSAEDEMAEYLLILCAIHAPHTYNVSTRMPVYQRVQRMLKLYTHPIENDYPSGAIIVVWGDG